jgi:hypothetical protein
MSAKIDMNMRWEDQKVVKKDGVWIVEGSALRNCHLLSLTPKQHGTKIED